MLKEGLWVDGVASPDEATAYEERLKTVGPPSLLVYDLDGRVIDRFKLLLGSVGAGSDEAPAEE